MPRVPTLSQFTACGRPAASTRDGRRSATRGADRRIAPKTAAVGAGYRGAALIPTDWDAFWYQAALLSDTARLARPCFLRPNFLD